MTDIENKHLHIIAFATPYPPNYGGVIDVFYKIKALYDAGIKITLHCFTYGDHQEQSELEKICEKVYYYPRKESPFLLLHPKPYITCSRSHPALIINLTKDNYPILFEGIHSCLQINNPKIENRLKLYRAHNIEKDYYRYLYKSSSQPMKKIYFALESAKLSFYEKDIIKYSDIILPITEADRKDFCRMLPNHKVLLIPGFHENDNLDIIPGTGDYIMFHGNLSVEENIKTIEYIIENTKLLVDIPIVIAGKNPSERLKKLISNHKNISLIENPDNKEMGNLIKNAHILLMLTFQPTGLKLKLLNSLFNGRHIIANKDMLYGTNLDKACHIMDETHSLSELILALMEVAFTEKDIENRKEIIKNLFDNKSNAELLIKTIYQK